MKAFTVHPMKAFTISYLGRVLAVIEADEWQKVSREKTTVAFFRHYDYGTGIARVCVASIVVRPEVEVKEL